MAGQLIWLENLSGASRPWKVASRAHRDDVGLPQEFVLKHFRGDADFFPRLTEYVAGRLGTEIANAPPIELLEVTSDFLDSLERLSPIPQGLGSATPGIHVGVAWLDGVDVLRRDYTVLRGLERREQPGEIIAADTLVQNIDRHDENILVKPGALFGRANTFSTRSIGITPLTVELPHRLSKA